MFYLLLLCFQVPEEHPPRNWGLPYLPRPVEHLHLTGCVVVGGACTMGGKGGGGEAKGLSVGLLRSARASDC